MNDEREDSMHEHLGVALPEACLHKLKKDQEMGKAQLYKVMAKAEDCR